MKTVIINSEVDRSYDCLFEGWEIIHSNSPDKPSVEVKEADLVFLVGDSSDVHPELYGEEAEPECGFTDKLQDLETMRFISIACRDRVPVVGVCKGAQQLCVAHLGRLRQHVPRVGAHNMLYQDKPVTVQADHHQVMEPPEDALIVATNEELLYPDIVQFKWDMVGFQYHPEWSDPDEYARVLFNEVVEALCRT